MIRTHLKFDPRDPLSYRVIALTSSVYNIYCAVLNNRLNVWVENNDKLEGEQCGFRKRRSTVDQLLALTNLVVTRTKLNQSTFTAFVDFKKAYDFINRDKLWKRLFESGISGKMLNASMSLYTYVSSCVRGDSFKTECFNVHSGLRQAQYA